MEFSGQILAEWNQIEAIIKTFYFYGTWRHYFRTFYCSAIHDMSSKIQLKFQFQFTPVTRQIFTLFFKL